MKVKVFLKTHVLIEADTIDTLKASIMADFYMTPGELSERLLVRDNRDLIANGDVIIDGCVDLLQLADGSTLDDFCKDGDTLVLGWKGSCVVRLVTDFILKEGHNIEFDNSFTLRQFKRRIKKLTGEPVTNDNLPEALLNGDEKKPLLFFGYYRIWPLLFKGDFDFEIHRHKNNMPVSIYPIMSMERRDANGNKFLCHFTETPRFWSKEAYKKYKKNEKRKIESKEESIENPKKKKKNKAKIIQSKEESIENPKKKKKNKSKEESIENPKKKKKKKKKKKNNNKSLFQGMEGDKEEASCSNVVAKESHPFNKDRANIKKKNKKKNKKIMEHKGIM